MKNKFCSIEAEYLYNLVISFNQAIMNDISQLKSKI